MVQVDVSVSHSVEATSPPLSHYDVRVFPDDINWYSLLEKYATNGNLDIRVVQANDTERKCNSILPLVRIRNKWGLVTLASLQNYYSVDFRPLCSTHHARAFIEPMVVECIRSELPDVFCLQPLDRDAPETALIKTAFRNQGWRIHQAISHVNWVHDFNGDYEDYIRMRPGRLRNTLKRQSLKIKALNGFHLSIHDGQSDLDELLQDYQTIYDRSWKVPEPNNQFVPMFISAMADSKHLRLGLIKIGDRPIAAHFWIVKQGHAYIYKLAHDKEYDRYSPGTVLMAEMVRYVMEKDLVRRLDFLTGDDKYKRDWMSERRTKLSLIAYNPRSLHGNTAYVLDRKVKPIVRQLAKQWKNARQTIQSADETAVNVGFYCSAVCHCDDCV